MNYYVLFSKKDLGWVADLEETLKQFASKKLRRKYVKQPRRPAEYAHPFSCEGLGQWD